MKSLSLVLVALMGCVPAIAFAHDSNEMPDPPLHVDPALQDCSVEFSSDLTQDAFARFAREFGSTSAFKHMAPPMTLGKGGVEVALQQMSFHVEDHSDAWNDTFAHPDATHELGSDLSFPKFRIRVGVTDDIDLGAYWTRNPDANYGWLGLEMKYGLLRQSETRPISLSVRGAWTKTLYVSDMEMHAISADAEAGRTFWNIVTPYVGVGGDLVTARETADAVSLHSETQLVPRGFGGVEVRAWHIAIGAEAEVGAINRSEFKVSAVF
jgi:hypothetical protein